MINPITERATPEVSKLESTDAVAPTPITPTLSATRHKKKKKYGIKEAVILNPTTEQEEKGALKTKPAPPAEGELKENVSLGRRSRKDKNTNSGVFSFIYVLHI